jgi:hypothetical protein
MVDGSAVDFIRLLKREIGEEVNYQEGRKRYEASHIKYELNNTRIDVNFSQKKGVEMLQHLRTILNVF